MGGKNQVSPGPLWDDGDLLLFTETTLLCFSLSMTSYCQCIRSPSTNDKNSHGLYYLPLSYRALIRASVTWLKWQLSQLLPDALRVSLSSSPQLISGGPWLLF